MPSLMKECPDCSTVVHVRKLGCPCGHVFCKSKSLTVKCASKQTLRLRATVCSLIIHELSLIHYIAKSVGCMELSFMVLCKIDKYYNQVKFQVLWPRLKVGSSTVMFTVRIR